MEWKKGPRSARQEIVEDLQKTRSVQCIVLQRKLQNSTYVTHSLRTSQTFQKRKIFRHRKRNEQALIYPLIAPSNLQFLVKILIMDSSRFYLFHSSRKPVPNPSFKLEFTVQLVEFSTTEFDCVWSASWSWVSEGPPGSIPQA